MSSDAAGANADQEAYWSSEPGRKWIRFEQTMDSVFAPVAERLIARAAPRPGERVIEIGCGTGGTTLELARAVGGEGHVLAVDISAPLLERARERAAGVRQVDFVRADAQAHAFEPDSADLLVSRFGVMFFSDPAAAFANMRRALARGGRLSFVSWAEIGQNPWFRVPRDAAVARLGPPAPRDPHAPGPLAFAERDHVRGILSEAGFADVVAEAEPIELVHSGSAASLAEFAVHMGPAARLLAEVEGTPEDADAIRRRLVDDFAPFASEGQVRVPGLFNFFSGTR